MTILDWYQNRRAKPDIGDRAPGQWRICFHCPAQNLGQDDLDTGSAVKILDYYDYAYNVSSIVGVNPIRISDGIIKYC